MYIQTHDYIYVHLYISIYIYIYILRLSLLHVTYMNISVTLGTVEPRTWASCASRDCMEMPAMPHMHCHIMLTSQAQDPMKQGRVPVKNDWCLCMITTRPEPI